MDSRLRGDDRSFVLERRRPRAFFYQSGGIFALFGGLGDSGRAVLRGFFRARWLVSGQFPGFCKDSTRVFP